MSTTAIETDLDTDISTLKSRISTLQSHRANLHAILLSQPNLSTRLSSNTPPSSSSSSSNSKTALDLISQQTRRNQENIYRACAGVTAYKVQDPDPHAVNAGHVLGVRVDVSVGSKFIETYHVLLNWSEEKGEAGEKKKKKVLRIHRHTVPPCIAVQQLAARWLPSSRDKGVSEGDEATESPEQHLVKFGRALRKELVSWHLRIKTVRDLREEAGLEREKEQHGQKRTSLESAGQVLNAFTSDDEEEEEEENLDAEEPRDEGNSSRILDIEADAAVRQVTVTWANRRTAIMVITKDGRVEKAASRTKDGVRDVALSRRAIGPLAGLVRRLTA